MADEMFRVGLLFELFDKTSKPAKKLFTAVNKVQEPLQKINKTTEKVQSVSGKLGPGYDKAARKVNTFARALKKASIQSKKVVRDSEQIKKKFDTLKEASMKMTVAGGIITAPFAALSGKAMQFGEGLGGISTMLDMSVKEVREKYNQDILKLAVDMGKSPDMITEAFYQGLSAGISPEEIISSLYTAGEAAIGGRSSVVEAVDGLTTVVNAYGKDVLDMQSASDLMFKAVKLGKTTFGELSGSLHNVLSSATGAGVQFSEVTAAIAAMTAQGVPTAVATTKIRSAIDELSKAGTKTSQLFGELSGTSFREFIQGGGSMQEALVMLEEHAKSNKIGINDLFGSVEAGGAAMMLTGKGTDKFVSALQEMESSSGATKEAFDKMTSEENVKFRWDQFQASLSAISITLGQLLLPSVNKLLTGINRVIAKVQMFTEEHPVLARNIMLPIAALGILLTVLGSVGMVVGVVGGGIMQFISTAKTMVRVISSLNLAFLASPVFWVIAGIVALIVITVLLVKNWDKVKVFLLGMWEKIKGAFGNAFAFISGLFDRMPGWMKILFIVFAPFLAIPFLVIRHWDTIRTFFAPLVGFLVRTVTAITGAAGAGFTWIADHWKRLVQLFLYLNPVTGPVMAFRKLLTFLHSINLFESGARVLGTLVEGIKSTMMAPVEAVKTVVQKIGNLLPHSPAKEGPLADLNKTGPGLINTLAGGITANPVMAKLGPVMGKIKELLNVEGGLSGINPGIPAAPIAAGPALPGGGTTITIQYNPVINSENKEEITAVLQNHTEDLKRIILETIRGEKEQKERRGYAGPAW